MSSQAPIKLRIPRQDLGNFTVFELNASAAKAWANDLPAANSREVVMQLRRVIADLNRVTIPPEVRYQIIEALRPSLYIAVSSLTRQFLNQPVVLPEMPRQLAEQTYALYGSMQTAYTIAAVQGIRQHSSISHTNPARLVCQALHRAITQAGCTLLHTFQLYQPVEVSTWMEINQLYALAERQKLDKQLVNDPIYGNCSIAQSFIRILLLACAKPNQMRQVDMAAVFKGMGDWSRHCDLKPTEGNEGLYVIDLAEDHGPLFNSLYQGNHTESCRVINTEPLVNHLEVLKEQDDKNGKKGIRFDKDTVLPSNVLDHLIHSLGVMSTRNFGRSSFDEELLIAPGLSSVHFQLTGGKSLEALVYGDELESDDIEDDNPFLNPPSETRDDWEKANPHDDTREVDEQPHEVGEVDITKQYLDLIKNKAETLTPEQRHPVYRLKGRNVGPGGYCLEWSDQLPGDIRTGDIVCLREQESDHWVIAVIRWVSSLHQASTLVGVELLSPKAMPFAARIHYKTGSGSDLTRVLLLPEIKLVGQPHTLITPRVGFKERQKVTLLKEGEEYYIQLNRMISGTPSFAQFEFRYIKHLEEVATSDVGTIDGNYESIWNQI